jgi:hypothetical protein
LPYFKQFLFILVRFLVYYIVLKKSKTERKYFKDQVDIEFLKILRELTKKCEFILDFEIKENPYAFILAHDKEEVKNASFLFIHKNKKIK